MTKRTPVKKTIPKEVPKQRPKSRVGRPRKERVGMALSVYVEDPSIVHMLDEIVARHPYITRSNLVSQILLKATTQLYAQHEETPNEASFPLDFAVWI